MGSLDTFSSRSRTVACCPDGQPAGHQDPVAGEPVAGAADDDGGEQRQRDEEDAEPDDLVLADEQGGEEAGGAGSDEGAAAEGQSVQGLAHVGG